MVRVRRGTLDNTIIPLKIHLNTLPRLCEDRLKPY